MSELTLSTLITTNAFVKRQEFRIFKENNKLKLINPDDDEILLCECETAFHDNCIIDDNVPCPYCGKRLKDEVYYSKFILFHFLY